MKKETKIFGSIAAIAILSIAGTAVITPHAPGNIKSYLQEITSEPRGAGLSGEQDQIKQLSTNLKNWGYDVSLDEFKAQTRLGEAFTSQNVIAKKKSSPNDPNADILIVSAHIDSIASTTGAIDNASGVAALEDIAYKIKSLPSDTEVWFAVFSGEEEGLLGSTHFAQNISDSDKKRIIGDIQMDMIGQNLTEGFDIDTATGQENVLTDLLVASAKEITGDSISVSQEKSSDHVAFTVAGIPSVMITQHGDGYENHEIMDNIDQVDINKLQKGADIVKDTVKKIMAEDTTLPASKQASLTEDTYGYLNPYDEIIDIDTSLQGMKNTLGTDFAKIDTRQDDILGTVDTYQASICWLDMDNPLKTNLVFYNDNFANGEILAYDDGISIDTMKQTLTDFIGEPEVSTDENGAKQFFWGWLLGRTGYQMNLGKEGKYTLTVSPYSLGNEELSDIQLGSDGNPSEALDDNSQKIWDDILSKVLPKEQRAAYMDRIVMFTDGVRYVAGFTNPAEPDNSNNTMWLDQNDLLDQDGNYRHYYKSVATVIHEFGHVLGMNQDQLDVSAVEDSYTLPPYTDDSYMAAFMKDFYPDQDVNDDHANENHVFREHPDEYVSLYANDKTMEDFAESFKCFVLMDKQKGNTTAEDKINFFYNYSEMVKIRTWIRGNFDWLN